MVDGVLLEAREAWARICRRGQTSFDDWVMIGKACAIGRAESLKKAGTNRPFGRIFQRHMADFLVEHGLDQVRSQERYWALQIVDNLDAVASWRATIDDAQRRRFNHPQSIWLHWRKTTQVNGKRKGRSPRTLAGTRVKPVF
jgi:hypothetical protein